MTVGVFSWPQLENDDSLSINMIQALWYSSLVLSVSSVCIGLYQNVFLARISCTANSNLLLRELLTVSLPNGKRKPRASQIIVWLLAVELLEWSIFSWLGGFLVFLWEVAKMTIAKQSEGNVLVSCR